MRKHLLSALLAVCLVATAFAQQGKVYETRTVKVRFWEWNAVTPFICR